MRRFCHALDMARTQYHALASLFMPRLVQGLRPMGIALLLWAVMTVPAGAVLGWSNYDRWVMASAATSFFLFVSMGMPIYILARRRCADNYLALRRTMLEAGLDRSSTLETAEADCHRLLEAIDSRQRAEIGRANEKLFAAMGAGLSRRERARRPRSRPLTRRGWPRSRPPAIGSCSKPTPNTLPCSPRWRAAT